MDRYVLTGDRVVDFGSPRLILQNSISNTSWTKAVWFTPRTGRWLAAIEDPVVTIYDRDRQPIGQDRYQRVAGMIAQV